MNSLDSEAIGKEIGENQILFTPENR